MGHPRYPQDGRHILIGDRVTATLDEGTDAELSIDGPVLMVSGKDGVWVDGDDDWIDASFVRLLVRTADADD